MQTQLANVKSTLAFFPYDDIKLFNGVDDSIVIEVNKPIDDHCGVLYRFVYTAKSKWLCLYDLINLVLYKHTLSAECKQNLKDKHGYLKDKGYIDKLLATAPVGRREWDYNNRLIIGLRDQIKKELASLKDNLPHDCIDVNLVGVLTYPGLCVHVSGFSGKLIVVKDKPM